jgi:serine/threonine-protein kinase
MMSTNRKLESYVSVPDLPCDEITDAEWLQSRVGDAVGCSHRIVRHLASGGMGHVFLAEHIHLGAYAAVKVPRTGSEAARSCLQREARMLGQLQHPNIVSVLDVGQLADGLPYMMTEYVSGLELEAWLDGSGAGRLTWKRSIGVLRQVAAAIDYLHAQGVVHGDIKPSNIMIDPRAHDFVKLVDFGIAYREDPNSIRRGVVGTPAYMAPEQARGDACGAAIDGYGIAALALELLTGRPPYDYSDAQAALTAILTQPPALPSHRGMTIPGLDDVFAKGLHAEPSQRFAIATEFVEALEQVMLDAEAERTLITKALALKAKRPRTLPVRPLPQFAHALKGSPTPPQATPAPRPSASLQAYRSQAQAKSLFYKIAWRAAAMVAAGMTAWLQPNT